MITPLQRGYSLNILHTLVFSQVISPKALGPIASLIMDENHFCGFSIICILNQLLLTNKNNNH